MTDLLLAGSLAACDRAADYSSDSDSSRLFVSRTALHSSARRSISDFGTEITRLTSLRNRANDSVSGASDSGFIYGLEPTMILSLLSVNWLFAGPTPAFNPTALKAFKSAPCGVSEPSVWRANASDTSLFETTKIPNETLLIALPPAPARTVGGYDLSNCVHISIFLIRHFVWATVRL